VSADVAADRIVAVGRFDGGDDPPVAVLMETLARALDREATTLPPLYPTVDPEAIEALLGRRPPAPDRHTLRVEFAYEGHVVSLTGDGEIQVRRVSAGDA
jgi:hypothetical protein